LVDVSEVMPCPSLPAARLLRILLRLPASALAAARSGGTTSNRAGSRRLASIRSTVSQKLGVHARELLK
jgi:hypothetical protein